MATLALLRILAVILLVALNAFFVAAEFALVSLRDTRVHQLIEAGSASARIVRRLQQRLDDFLPAVQFGVTLASLALGWIGEPTLAAIFVVPLADVPYAAVYAHTIAAVVAFCAITYFHVILGELVPKSLALQRTERVALSVAAPMEAFMTLSRPLLHMMARSASLVLRGFGSKLMREGGVHSPEELKLIVTASRRVGLIPDSQEEMIHRAVELTNVTVREIMVPRQNIFSLPADMPLEEAMARVVDMQHSRIPVYDPAKGKEHIIGTLYSKDLSRFIHLRITSQARFGLPSEMTLRVRHIMRDVFVVPETKAVSDLLAEFKQRKRHLAIAVDEFGSTVGLVTVEDAIEQVVGNIEDEFDVAEQPPLLLETGGLVLEGADTIRDLETQLRLRLPRDEGYETLGGFVMAKLGRIPKVNDSFVFDHRRYTVLEMDERRVGRIKIEPLTKSEPEPEPEDATPRRYGS